jgi:hypothetical protein
MRNLLVFIVAFIILDALISGFLHGGLNKYYGLESDAEIAFIGHSHLMLGTDKSKIEKAWNKKIAKYTREGVNIADRDLMIDQVLSLNKNTKIVVYGVDAWMFTGEGLSANSYKLFYPFMGLAQVDDFVRSQTSFLDFWQKKIIQTSRFNEGLISGSFRGYLNNWDNLKLGRVDTLLLKKNVENGGFRKINSTQENIKIFEASINKLVKKGIKVYLVYVPTISYYNQAERDKFESSLSYFRTFSNKTKNVEYLEFIKGWDTQYDYFFDPIHLNPLGQQAFSDTLINHIDVRTLPK